MKVVLLRRTWIEQALGFYEHLIPEFERPPTDRKDDIAGENGEGGIRTHGRLPFKRFRVVRFRPLSHLSRPMAPVLPRWIQGRRCHRQVPL